MLKKLLILLVSGAISIFAEMPEVVEIPTPIFWGISSDSANVWVYSNKLLIKVDKENYIHTEYKTECKNIRTISHDKKGNLYVSCGDKIMRFDGNNWFTYNYEFSDYGNIYSNYFRMDSSGTMYYRNNQGLFKLNKDSVIEINESYRKADAITFTRDKIYYSYNNVLYLYKDSIEIELTALPWTDDVINGIAVKEDKIIFTTNFGLYYFADDTIQTIDETKTFVQIKLNDNGSVWLSDGYKLYEYNNSIVQKWSFSEGIKDFAFIDGNLWVITSKSLYKEHNEEMVKVEFDDYSYAGIFFLDVVRDKSGRIWLLNTNVIYSGEKFTYEKDNDFKNDHYTTFDIADNGDLWVGGYNYIYRKNNFTFAKYKTQQVQTEAQYSIFCGSNNNVFAKHRIGDLWGHTNVFYKFDFEEDKFIEIDSVDGKKILGLSKDNFGRIWYILKDKMIRYEDGEYKQIELPVEISQNSDVNIISVFSGDSLWQLYHNRQIYFYDGERWDFVNVTNFFGQFPFFWDITLYKGKLLIASVESVVEYKDGKFEYFEVGDYNFKNTSVLSFYKDIDGNLWMISVDGIYIYQEGGVIIKVKDYHSSKNTKFKISPNPASDYIEINSNLPFTNNRESDIKIYNSYGECVMTVETIHELTQLQRIDISHLPAGIYFIRVGNEILKFTII